jgi:rSAM/selenodomain-associated transferase 1
MQDNRLILFVKAPRAGEVKTRLARVLGPESACEAYKALVGRLLRNLKAVANVELCHSPDDAAGEIAMWLRPGWRCRPQGGGDLGERLHRAFERAFSDGARRVAVIGSDCPDVTPSDIQEAFARLDAFDVVLGPATDGGYWLIALNRAHPELFTQISWSTEKVLSETLRGVRSAGLNVHLLSERSDVDDEPAWREFLAAAERGGLKPV